MTKKIILIGDGNSIHLKKWINFFVNDFKIILISDTKLDSNSKELWNNLKIKYYDFNINGNKIIKGFNLIKKGFLYNCILFKNRKNSVVNFHYLSLNILLTLPSIFLMKNKISTLWGSDFNSANGFQKIILKIAFKISYFITSDTEEILENINKQYNVNENRLIYINHGVDSKIFNAYNDKNIKKGLRVFSPRALQEFYNHHILFENIDLLIKEFGKNIKIVFIDYNTHKDYKNRLLIIKNKFPNNVEILKPLSQIELSKEYKKANIIISIPQNDGFPVTLVESLFSLKPVIGINKSDYKKILNENLIIKTYNINEIIDKIKYYLNSRIKIDNEIKEKKEKYFNNFDYYKNMKKIKELYLK